MRTRLTILLAVTVALAIGASALMTSQFGMREWPVAPAPDTATRLITPSEAAGRVTERAASDRDEPAERAQRDPDDRASAADEAPAATTPVGDTPRSPRRAATPERTDEPAATPESETAEAPAQTSTPPTTPVPASPTTPVEGQHTRNDDVTETASESPSSQPTLDTVAGGFSTPPSELEDGPKSGRLRDLLDALP